MKSFVAAFYHPLSPPPISKSKEYIYNYVDRVRFAESQFPDYKCPSRGSGWRQNKSVSHLDLATSCHSAASGLNHWSSSHQSRHQLRHSRSLDYNHIDRCKDALDIAEYYWRLDHTDPEIYDEEDEEIIEPEHNGGNGNNSQLKYVSEHHLAQHYRDFKCAEDNYHHSANNNNNNNNSNNNNNYQSSRQLSSSSTSTAVPPQLQQQQHQLPAGGGTIPSQAFEFASDSCSLRRSRSLAVIREETFSDLQINSSSDSRRSQLIPRARLVHRGYFRERDRIICSNNKHHHHHYSSREKLTNSTAAGGGGGASAANVGHLGTGGSSSNASVEIDEQSNESVAETCDSHQHQLQLQQHYKQQQQQHQHQHQQQQQHNKSHHPQQKQQQQQQPTQQLHYHPLYHEATHQNPTSAAAALAANDYYDHLKRLDKLALGLVAEQLHPWHNDKSDLESLNSDYFKNSLHQSQHHENNKQHFELEAFEQAVNLLSSAHDKPRIYQSRRQKRSGQNTCPKLTHSAASGGESCPETSQSSVFPETTTSNSEDQSDSGSLSEQEYDITKIEEIYQKTHIEGDDESYEIISLTTTTRTRFETTEDEEAEEEDDHIYQQNRRHLDNDECDYNRRDDDETGEDSNQHTTTDTEVEGSTLKRSRAVSDNLQKIIAYDSVYLSSEESSDSTIVDVDHCETSLEVASLRTCIDEVETLLHISIEDAIYEPKAKQHKVEIECGEQRERERERELDDEGQQRPISFVETINTKIEILQQDSNSNEEAEGEEEFSPIYTQILKVEHTPSGGEVSQQDSNRAPVASIVTTTASSIATCTAVGVTSSAASKPKILSVVEKRKLKRYSDSAYSSNFSDSGSYPSNESFASSNHLKRQVAEPLYIPLKSNLSENQFHSLPDVNIGQSLKLCESIDAQLRSSYNLDSYQSLDDDDDNSVEEGKLNDKTTTTTDDLSPAHSKANHVLESSHQLQRTKRDNIVTSEEIYDSIKRFGRAHQKYRQREIKECQQQQQQKQQKQQQQHQQQEQQDQQLLQQHQQQQEQQHQLHQEKQQQEEQQQTQQQQSNEEIERDQVIVDEGTIENANTEEIKTQLSNKIPVDKIDKSSTVHLNQANDSKSLSAENIEHYNHQPDSPQHPSSCDSLDEEESHNKSDKFMQYSCDDNYEKSKEAPISIVSIENFSQQIERRAKEIRQSSRRRNKLQQIEFANRSKFRLENTLADYSAAATKDTKEYEGRRTTKPSDTFRIVVTDAQNNIIEEDSIERQKIRDPKEEEEKENNNTINFQETKKDLKKFSDDTTWLVKVNKEKIKNRSTLTNPSHHHINRQSSLKRPPAKPKRQQYPSNAGCCNLPLSSSAGGDLKKIAPNSPKTKERRVLSNQIYRARPVKVITSTDSFRRQKVKQVTSKMSRPQILQVIDNKRKAANGTANGGNNSMKDNIITSNVCNQLENEYFKKVDAVRCYWSKLAKDDKKVAEENEDERQKELESQHQLQEVEITQPSVVTMTQQQQKNPLPLESHSNGDKEFSRMIQQPSNQEQPPSEKRHFILGSQPKTPQTPNDKTISTTKQSQLQSQPQLQSQSPQSPHLPQSPQLSQSAVGHAGDTQSSKQPMNPEDYCSFMPSIEIVELDGDKKATIVAAMPSSTGNETDALDATEPQFDHIRYKILKSQQLLRSNILARNKKEAQFDGLIQYLQDYSFQELLSNNNVVIVEPVRTKIERSSSNLCTHAAHYKKGLNTVQKLRGSNDDILDDNGIRKPRTSSVSSSIASGYGAITGAGGGAGGGIKRHFFYQPVRVNRELYEEELPNPDTVRNVRKFFEENILPTPGQGLLTTTTTTTMTTTTTTLTKSKNKNNISNGNKNNNNSNTSLVNNKQVSPKSRRARKYRYLTIDTSYGHTGTSTAASNFQQQHKHQGKQHQQQKQQQQQPLDKQQDEHQQLQSTDQQTSDKGSSSASQQSRKWDTASLSSGVSSGDLSSPCECNEAETETTNHRVDVQTNDTIKNGQTPLDADTRHQELQGVHVQDIVKKHNNSGGGHGGGVGKKSCRPYGTGIPVRSSSIIRPRNTISGYSALHKSGQTNNYRNVYENHVVKGKRHHDSDDEQGADEREEDEEEGSHNDSDDDDLFGDIDDDDNELCDTYYVSNDVLRKIRECGSSVTYYGGRVVQSSTTGNHHQHHHPSGSVKSFENHCNNGQNGKVPPNNKINSLPATMLTQTQTMARVREIETCCNKTCHPANECHHNYNNNNYNNTNNNAIERNNSNNNYKLLFQQKLGEDNKPTTKTIKSSLQQQKTLKTETKGSEGYQESRGDVGVTFKLVKSNSCSSRLELAGADVEIVEEDLPEETEVVRKRVHQFETSTINTGGSAAAGSCVAVTINNQMPLCGDTEVGDRNLMDSGVKPVTVNNHINVANGISSSTPTDKSGEEKKNDIMENKDVKGYHDEMKTYQTEAKDIHLIGGGTGGAGERGAGVTAVGAVAGAGVGGGSSASSLASVKVCRNKNVDLAFTFVKHQHPPQSKSLGIKDSEIGISKTHKISSDDIEYESLCGHMEDKCVTYENTLLPIITTTATTSNTNTGIKEIMLKAGQDCKDNTSPITPSQIIVPVQIHRTEDSPIVPKLKQLPITTSAQYRGEEKSSSSFPPLSTTSSVTSKVDKSMVKHYVANDRSIYEKRKYDDIEFEEFEVYDPTKDFEKLIEEEEAKRAASAAERQDNSNQRAGQQSGTSTMSSMKTAKSQQTNATTSTETETDCYDSLDDKL